MKQTVHAALENSRDKLITDLTDLIAIESVQGKAQPGAPFGPGPAKALEHYLALGESFGFDTMNYDNKAGHITWNTKHEGAKDDVGILVHLDVVPAPPEGWTTPPYEAQVRDGRIYGRGSSDNKGPAVGALYILKALKERGYKPKRGIRIIAGTNEETGFEGIDHYNRVCTPPAVSLVPDGSFPVINGEMGIMDVKLTFPLSSSGSWRLEQFRGGTAANMVPAEARARFTRGEEVLDLSAEGVSVHGSTPEKGVNAVSLLMDKLVPHKDELPLGQFIDFYQATLNDKFFGEGLGCPLEDRDSGKLKVNPGVLFTANDRINLIVNIRYPVTAKGEEVSRAIGKTCTLWGVTTEVLRDSAPLFHEVDSSLIQTIMKAYQEETGDRESEPIVMGGGTYARTMPNGVALGGGFPGDEGTAHQIDEYAKVENLISGAKILASIIMELAG